MNVVTRLQEHAERYMIDGAKAGFLWSELFVKERLIDVFHLC
ncbi:hypothetical protein SDC9_05058 [bioreactor metagenome]|uniref:Uncharacterized protein n=1 Tax=bioreactor metagenome TaxID=1076179 RepID=A0A644SY14_9ZZZZ